MKKIKYDYVKVRFFGLPKLAPFLKPYRRKIFAMMSFGVMVSTFDVLVPLFQRYALNNLTNGQLEKNFLTFVFLAIVTFFFQGLTNYLSCLYAANIEILTARDMRNTVFAHLQTLSFTYYNQNSVGYIQARVMSDTARIGETVSWTLMQVVWNMVYMVGMVIVMININIKLTLLICAILPLMVLLFILFQNKLTKFNRKIREINSKITGNFNEGITGAKTVKSLVVEDKITSEFNKETSNMKKVSMRHIRFRSIFNVSMSVASSFALAIALWRGGILTQAQAMEIGTYSIFMTYAISIVEPIAWVVEALSSLIQVKVNIERVMRLLNVESDVKDTPEVIEKYGDIFNPKKENWEELKGDIEFKNVTFMYPDGDQNVLENFNLKIPQGTNLAIVGETGAGKSTLVNLVCRFYEPTEGEVLIDGVNAKERSQLWLHSNIGYVLQTPHLFSGTIIDNIRYGNENATEEDVMNALRQVSAEGIVEKLPNGLYTDVGEGGDLLSTGEKQLISFARAIIVDPKILILDEATASVDTITEKKIQDAIDKVIEGRTSIVIAHRLSTVTDADNILVVNDGKIVEQGTHVSLLRQKGYYYNLFINQFNDDTIKTVLN